MSSTRSYQKWKQWWNCSILLMSTSSRHLPCVCTPTAIFSKTSRLHQEPASTNFALLSTRTINISNLDGCTTENSGAELQTLEVGSWIVTSISFVIVSSLLRHVCQLAGKKQTARGPPEPNRAWQNSYWHTAWEPPRRFRSSPRENLPSWFL